MQFYYALQYKLLKMHCGTLQQKMFTSIPFKCKPVHPRRG